MGGIGALVRSGIEAVRLPAGGCALSQVVGRGRHEDWQSLQLLAQPHGSSFIY
jgi:hypothetical protein